MFGTLQDRLPKELQAGRHQTTSRPPTASSARSICPTHNARFARPPALAESAFVASPIRQLLAEILCVEEERVVARDNTVAYGGLQAAAAAEPLRAHYVKASVKVRDYPDGTLAVFHGPRLPGALTMPPASLVAQPLSRPPREPLRRGDLGLVDLWTVATRLPTNPQGQHNQQKRTSDVLPKPDNFKSYRHSPSQGHA